MPADPRRLTPDPHEQAGLELIRQLDASGHSLRSIARQLDAAGYKPRSTRWSPSTIAAILRRLREN